MIGIAREAAVNIGKKIKYPEIEVKECDEEIDFDVKIENPDLCMRYGARIVKDVKIAPYLIHKSGFSILTSKSISSSHSFTSISGCKED